MKKLTLLLAFCVAACAQSTVLAPPQVPPPAVPVIAGPPLNLETPVAGTVANTWTLKNPVTNFVMCMWNGLWLTVTRDFIFTGNGSGGTLLTLTPAAIAAGTWTTPGSTSACLYQ